MPNMECCCNSYYIFVLCLLPQSGDTPLHKAAQWGHRKIAEELLLRGADADCVNNVSMCA